MSSQTTMFLLCLVEFVLWCVLAYFFRRREAKRKFPAMHRYLMLRVCTMPIYLFLFYGADHSWFNGYCFDAYFYFYWSMYLISAVLLYFICIEVLRAALVHFVGLMRAGTLLFHWAALISIIVTLATVGNSHRGLPMLLNFAYGMMHAVSVLELCLLGFVCMTMNTLRLSPRSMAFGLALGFGVLSANDFIVATLMGKFTKLSDPLQFFGELMTMTSIAVWAIYSALPEPESKPVVVPVSSAIYRWNEIASALGHTGTQVAVRQPAEGFFLSDVERVVEKVLSRNLQEQEPKQS